MMTKFSIEDNFFIIDSNNLNDIKTKLYGYYLSEDKNPPKDKLNLNGLGAYLYVLVNEKEITIYQDYVGCYGLYFFQDRDYFALSNSFIYLVDYIKTKYKLTLNKDFAYYLLTTSLCSEIYKDTLVNEITTFSRNTVLKINKQTKKINLDYIDYKENTIEFGTDEYFNILDDWYNRWLKIIQKLKANNENISVDLSGGFDSRCVLLLFLGSGIDLNTIEVNSIDDKLHCHAEDFEIASQIANDYNFTLNKRRDVEKESFSLEDTINLSFYTKLGFHKEMYWKHSKYITPKYSFGGASGELIRKYWDYKNINEMIKTRINSGYIYSQEIRSDISQSVSSILNKSYNLIKDNYFFKKFEDSNCGFDWYKETRCRNHFGKAMIEDYLSNSIRLAPLLDSGLHKLKLNSSDCLDKNLLLATIFTRYCPNLLNYKFEGKRFIEQETIEFAKKINETRPFKKNNDGVADYNIILSSELYPQTEKKYVAKKDELSEFDFLLNVFHSDSFRYLFTTYFSESILDTIDKDVQKRKYHPLFLAYGAIAITKIINDVLISETLSSDTTFDALQNFSIKSEDKKFYFCHSLKDRDYDLKDRNYQIARLTIKQLQHSKSYRIGRLIVAPLSIPLKVYRLIRDYNLLKKSDLFDTEYYLAKNKDVQKQKKNPILHYLRFGWKEGRNPSEQFDSKAYLNQRPDVKVAGICPLVHYIKFGKK